MNINLKYEDVEMDEIIGGGGAGVIYKGYIRGRREAVAIKTLFDIRVGEESRREYLNELAVLRRLNHSNIVTFLGACNSPSHMFFAMELCKCSLFDILHRNREVISNSDMIRYATDIACAMEYLHAQSPAVIHRDLKSLNVLQARDGSLKLCDFGLADTRTTQAGTPAYMAPELLSARQYNKSVDVYSFAILLWEIFHKSIPFCMLEPFEIRERVLSGVRPPVSPSVPVACASLIRQSWAMDARDRPDFTAIVDVLLDLSETIPSHTSTNTNCVTSNKQNVPSHNNSKSNISAVTQSKTAKMHEIDSLDSLIRRK